MSQFTASRHGLDAQGFPTGATMHWNLSTAPLVEHAVARGEGLLSKDGALVVETGLHTGRSANDKFIVHDHVTGPVIWWGKTNKPITSEQFATIKADFAAALAAKETLFVQDLFGGSQPEYRVNVRVITEFAWHSLFIRTLLVRPDAAALADFLPEFTIVDLPSFKADPARHGCRSGTIVAVDFEGKMILIGGTRYAGEMKKSVFSILNYLLPVRGVMPMHCSANIGADGRTAVFFGLSGTGKTTLSADASRTLIGDDEHGWSDTAVFNFEGGCYAKAIKLSQDAEPEIWAASHRFGTVLENVVIDPTTRELDLDSQVLTENTRSAYPIDFIPNIVKGSQGGHPRTIVMLTADAFGVLPPIARMTDAQAMYHFLSGYTAKVAGTERGVTEPTATFSTCFGAPFMVHHPTVYAQLLGERIAKHEVSCWLVNTGWNGGPYGVGKRMKIGYTRAMVNAAIAGRLHDVDFVKEPFFGLEIPANVPEVPSDVLDPRASWSDTAAYDAQAKKLAGLFAANFERFSAHASPDILAVAIKP